MEDVEPGVAHTSNAERPIEGVMTSLRQVDCAQDLRDRCHICISDYQIRYRALCRTRFGQADVTPSVNGGELLAGNQSARISSIPFFDADILWRLVLQVRPLSFMSIRGTFHCVVHSRPEKKIRSRPVPVCTNTVLIRSNRSLATRSEP